MNKKEFMGLVKEAEQEFKEEQGERVKDMIKERLKEYEMAKSTVARIEKQFTKLKAEGYKDIALLEYDG